MVNPMYLAWLGYKDIEKSNDKLYLENIVLDLDRDEIIESALDEIKKALSIAYKDLKDINIYDTEKDINIYVKLIKNNIVDLKENGYKICRKNIDDSKKSIEIIAKDSNGILYGVFKLLALINNNEEFNQIVENPKNKLRIINHWDNIDGTIERGYSGSSIFFESIRNKDIMKDIMKIIGIPASNDIIRKAFNDEYRVCEDLNRISDYARLLSSIGINSIVLNNTNVHKEETEFIDKRIDMIKIINNIMNKWGIKVYLSINFASPITLKELKTADPLNEEVINWWNNRVKFMYDNIPNLGGFMVKADSEGREGPFTYGRNHADGANMLGKALKPYGGILIWRCFVYNCKQDWRDDTTDRAKAAFDCFNPLDGEFIDNVYLQIKNGPMDFQVREPISPLFGAMENTNKIIEFQITQEYTGQQIDTCFLVPWWKEILDFKTYANNEDSKVKDRVKGVAGISNIGNDINWTGNFLAQANIYGYGRLIWNTDISSEEIVDNWIKLTFGRDKKVIENIKFILLNSWTAYENYTAPLGVGWMVTPGTHYGCDVNGYEYSPWGTYHKANYKGLGIDRTIKSGSKYIEQYNSPLKELYENINTCPEELLLFFHKVDYLYKLKSGKSVIQHIYDAHFDGYEMVNKFIEKLEEIKEIIDNEIYINLESRFKEQLSNSNEWKDKINSYFYRISGIKDKNNRNIY